VNQSVARMIQRYNCKNVEDYKNALKEIVQEVALYGLARTDFFQRAAFCGGTALRIFHHLDRFSEDMDFSLQSKDEHFSFEPYSAVLEATMQEFGFRMETKVPAVKSHVQSAFLKGNTLYHLLEFTALTEPVSGVVKTEKMTIKLEMDTNPPAGAGYEPKISLNPNPYQITIMDLPSLFAGKIHAILCRSYLKGRDLYDFVWYLQNDVPVNLVLLENALRQTGDYQSDTKLTLDEVKRLLTEHFKHLDYAKAREDTKPFLQNKDVLSIWSAEFFTNITEHLTTDEF